MIDVINMISVTQGISMMPRMSIGIVQSQALTGHLFITSVKSIGCLSRVSAGQRIEHAEPKEAA